MACNKGSRSESNSERCCTKIITTFFNSSVGYSGERWGKKFSETGASVTKPLAVSHEAVRSVTADSAA